MALEHTGQNIYDSPVSRALRLDNSKKNPSSYTDTTVQKAVRRDFAIIEINSELTGWPCIRFRFVQRGTQHLTTVFKKRNLFRVQCLLSRHQRYHSFGNFSNYKLMIIARKLRLDNHIADRSESQVWLLIQFFPIVSLCTNDILQASRLKLCVTVVPNLETIIS